MKKDHSRFFVAMHAMKTSGGRFFSRLIHCSIFSFCGKIILPGAGFVKNIFIMT